MSYTTIYDVMYDVVYDAVYDVIYDVVYDVAFYNRGLRDQELPTNYTLLLSCVAHISHRVALKIEKSMKDYMSIKAFLID